MAKKASLITFLSPFFQVATSSLCRSVAAAMLTPTADALLIKRSKNTVCFREEMQPFTFSNPSANSQNSLCHNFSSRKCNVGLKGLLICSCGSCCSPNTNAGRASGLLIASTAVTSKTPFASPLLCLAILFKPCQDVMGVILASPRSQQQSW